jgi:hypothetical protein
MIFHITYYGKTGVQFVSNLINHENKQFYSFEQIQEKLETNNFLMFYRLIARIPKAFKDCLKENLFDTHDTTDTFVKKIVSNKKNITPERVF